MNYFFFGFFIEWIVFKSRDVLYRVYERLRIDSFLRVFLRVNVIDEECGIFGVWFDFELFICLKNVCSIGLFDLICVCVMFRFVKKFVEIVRGVVVRRIYDVVRL